MHWSDAVCGEAPKISEPGISVQVRPADGVGVRVTVPVKPFRAVTVIVEDPVEPSDICGLGLTGPAATVKSWTVKVTVALWVRAPLVPVTVTV